MSFERRLLRLTLDQDASSQVLDKWIDQGNVSTVFKQLKDQIKTTFGLILNETCVICIDDNQVHDTCDLQAIVFGNAFSDKNTVNGTIVKLSTTAIAVVVNIDFDNNVKIDSSCNNSAVVIVEKKDKHDPANQVMKKLVNMVMSDDISTSNDVNDVFFEQYQIITESEDIISSYQTLNDALRRLKQINTKQKKISSTTD